MFKDCFSQDEYKELLKNKNLYAKMYMRYKTQGNIDEPILPKSNFRRLFTNEEYTLLQENPKLYQRCYYKWRRNIPIVIDNEKFDKVKHIKRVRKAFDYKKNVEDWDELTKSQKRVYYQTNHYKKLYNLIN